MRRQPEPEIDMGIVYAFGLILAVAVALTFLLLPEAQRGPEVTLVYIPAETQRSALRGDCDGAPCLPAKVNVAELH